VIEKTIADRATYDKAHQFPVGISYVLVNGQIVLSVDKLTGERPGKDLRGPGSLARKQRVLSTCLSLLYS
jgi:hypothetical protein